MDVCPGGDDNVDTDGDGVADYCDVLQGCNDFADLYSDLIINNPDFALLAEEWLCTGGCPVDIDDDGDTDLDDLLILANNWLCGSI